MKGLRRSDVLSLTLGSFISPTAIDVVTVYVFHEPSLLSSLQDNGLTGVMLKALVVKEVSFTLLSLMLQSYHQNID